MEIQLGKVYIFYNKTTKRTSVVIPVDGEVEYNQLGLSAGLVHYKDVISGKRIGYCGICHFEEHSFMYKE